MSAAVDFEAEIGNFLAEARTRARDEEGLTLADLCALAVKLIHLGVRLAATLANPGPEKKALVLAAVARLWDLAVGGLVLPWWLQVVWPFVAPVLRAGFLFWADVLVEQVYRQFEREVAVE